MENMIQTVCCACEQVLSFPKTEVAPRYCITCADEINEWSDNNEPTDADLEQMAKEYGEEPREGIEAFEDGAAFDDYCLDKNEAMDVPDTGGLIGGDSDLWGEC